MELNKNLVHLVGTIKTDVAYEYTVNGHNFYSTVLSVKRLNDVYDDIPIIFNEYVIRSNDLRVSNNVIVEGQFRSRNTVGDTHRKLVLYVFVNNICVVEANIPHTNVVEVEGYICKTPIMRQTPSGKTVADIIIACNVNEKRPYYIPAICWGSVARKVSTMPIGCKISCIGRFHSRVYNKVIGDKVRNGMAYELSVDKLEQLT